MVTFWIRQDRQETRLPGTVARIVNDWLAHDWSLDTHLFRVLPGETSSVDALERLDLERVVPTLGSESRPYLWFGHLPPRDRP